VENKRPRIHILHKFIEGPWGGGNQFLKALRGYLTQAGLYAENMDDADVILFNSYPFGNEHSFDLALKLKKLGKILVHRVDGPLRYVRGRDRAVDEIIFQFNSALVDGTVFQSKWSRDKNHELGMHKAPYETVIMNTADPDIFNPEGKRPFDDKKIRLIATSWSKNMAKGFDIYQHLDKHLDFNRYQMTFVGNSPVEFENITSKNPIPSAELAKILKEHDIYIAASRNDPCSNSLIEALQCGLPAVARNDGGHPEIVGKAGALFENETEVLDAIENVAQNYQNYQLSIDLPVLDEVGKKYHEFSSNIYQDYLGGSYQAKSVNFPYINFIRMKVKILIWKVSKVLLSLSEEVKSR
jgi:glycosyltransferase involved in cell wall biosynthesis